VCHKQRNTSLDRALKFKDGKMITTLKCTDMKNFLDFNRLDYSKSRIKKTLIEPNPAKPPPLLGPLRSVANSTHNRHVYDDF